MEEVTLNTQDERLIEDSMAKFQILGEQVKKLLQEVDELESQMADLVHLLGPLESIAVQKYPKFDRLFKTLKNVYPKKG